MRHPIAVILFLWGTVSAIHAQEADTTKVILPVLPAKNFRDSVRSVPKTYEMKPVIPDFREYNDLDNFDYSNNQMTFKLEKTSKKNIFNSSYSKFIIPTALISYGLLARGSEKLKELDHSTHHEISEHYTARIHLDDYTQFVPAIAVYGLDLAGIKAKNNFRDRTIVMATSHILMCATVHTIKTTTNIERPDGSNKHSFPSGHTAEAFTGAHILFKEYKDTSPWIALGGYIIAAGTGAMRVTNKKHWVSDVVTGAGIGIMSVEVSYLFLPLFHNMFGIKNKNSSLVIAPSIGTDNYGVGLAYTF